MLDGMNVEGIVSEIFAWQGAPWNGGGKLMKDFPLLNKLFRRINSTHDKPSYAYQGSLYRIHCRHGAFVHDVDLSRYRIVSKVWSDGSCGVLPITQFSDTLASFSKSPDFTGSMYYKVMKTVPAVFLVVDTGRMCGLDVMAFLHEVGITQSLYRREQEVIFPVLKSKLVREYHCTPNQFRYYMRSALC